MAAFYETRYARIEKTKNFMVSECFANVTITESVLIEAQSNQCKITIYIDSDMDSILSDDIYTTDDGIFAASAIDHTLNFEDMTTQEAEDLMNTIADGSYMDWVEEDEEEQAFNKLIDDCYEQMEYNDTNNQFINNNFIPVNLHISVWSFCAVCDSYGHTEADH